MTPATQKDLESVDYPKNIEKLVNILNARIAQNRMDEAQTLLEALTIMLHPLWVAINGKIYQEIKE